MMKKLKKSEVKKGKLLKLQNLTSIEDKMKIIFYTGFSFGNIWMLTQWNIKKLLFSRTKEIKCKCNKTVIEENQVPIPYISKCNKIGNGEYILWFIYTKYFMRNDESFYDIFWIYEIVFENHKK